MGLSLAADKSVTWGASCAPARAECQRGRGGDAGCPAPPHGSVRSHHHMRSTVPERFQALLVARHGMISEISANHRLQPPRRVRNPRMQPLAELLPNLPQLGCHSLADRLVQHSEVPRRAILPTYAGETQKAESVRPPFPIRCHTNFSIRSCPTLSKNDWMS